MEIPLRGLNAGMTFSEYQTEAHKTAVYPRIFTEDQILQIVGYLTADIPELADVKMWEVADSVHAAMDAIETPFNRMVYPLLGMVGEVGEFANKFKKIARDSAGVMDQMSIGDFEKEIGDIQWYVSETTTGLGGSLNRIAEGNIRKLADRQERGTLQGSGDNR